MRNRFKELNVRLTESEMDLLKRNSTNCGLTISGYIRSLINGFLPKSAPPLEYHEILCRLNEIYSAIRENRNDNFTKELREVILNIQAQISLPEPVKLSKDKLTHS